MATAVMMLRATARHALLAGTGRRLGSMAGGAPMQLAEVEGPTEPPLIDWTIGQKFDAQVRRYGSRLAIHDRAQRRTFTYAELADEVEAVAASLRQLGLGKGDRIGIWLPNMYQYLVFQYAAAKEGIILVTVNPAYRESEVEFALQNSGCRALVTHDRIKSSNYVSMLNDLLPELSSSGSDSAGHHFKRLPELRHIIHTASGKHFPGMIPYEALVSPAAAAASKDRATPELSAHDTINVQFTSGTTGLPKGVMLSHYNILNNARMVGHRLGLLPEDRMCVPVPLYHCFGLVMSNLACLAYGSELVYPNPTFDPEATLRAVVENQCSVLQGVPTMFIAMMNHPSFNSDELTSLRTGIMAGSVCPMETMRQVITKMHMTDVTICYGMTETSPVSFQTVADDPITARVETVGRVHPHLHCKVVDPSTGETQPVNVPGELLTRGYSVMRGYWNSEEKTREVLQDGWMHTGDLATIDEHGYCRIVGRIKDLIIRGGENISPRDIEDFFFTHPDIVNVAVIGVPDKVYGEVVCAWITPRNPPANAPPSAPYEMPELEASIREYCTDKIAHFKVPKYFVFANEFPMTVSGKIQKFIMRNKTIEMLGLEAK